MTSGRLGGRIALVTGSSRGIGRAIARRLAADGATVIVTARSLDSATGDPGTLGETVALIEARGGRAIAIACDLEDEQACAGLIPQAVEAAGGLDILVNNAGYADYVPIEAMPTETFDRTLTHYLRAPFVLTRAAIPHMKARGAGWIVNIGSVTAQAPVKPYSPFDTDGGVAVYAAAKAAINRLTQGAAAELLASNIAINLVAPSTAIKTPGATRYIPDDYPGENVAYLAEAVAEMCHLPAVERSGLLAHSMHFAAHHRLAVADIDDLTSLPVAEIPAWSHPAVRADGT